MCISQILCLTCIFSIIVFVLLVNKEIKVLGQDNLHLKVEHNKHYCSINLLVLIIEDYYHD